MAPPPVRALAALLACACLAACVTSGYAGAAPAGDAPAGGRESAAAEATAALRALPRAASPPGDATLAMRDLRLALPSLSGAAAARADSILARPDSARSWCDTVCVHYSLSGDHAVDPRDDDRDGVPDYVALVEATVAKVVARYAKAGYRAPLPDGGVGGDERTDIYLRDVGSHGYYGYCDVTGLPGADRVGAAYCVLDDDYAKAEFPDLTPLANLQVTAAHELFHAVQFAYDYYEDSWLMEATASWAEDELFDDADDNVRYLRASQLVRPEVPVDRFAGLWPYGQWIVFRWLAERFPERRGGMPVVIRDLWRGAVGERWSLPALTRAVQRAGGSWPEAFVRYAAANRRPRTAYDEGAAQDYPRAPLWESVRLSATEPAVEPLTTDLDHLTSATLRAVPGDDLAPGTQLGLDLDLPPVRRGSAAFVVVEAIDGTLGTRPVTLDAAGNATVSVPFDPATVRAVEVTLANASIRMDCGRATAYACEGEARDDDQPVTVTLTATPPA